MRKQAVHQWIKMANSNDFEVMTQMKNNSLVELAFSA
jgi:hypothetical protein